MLQRVASTELWKWTLGVGLASSMAFVGCGKGGSSDGATGGSAGQPATGGSTGTAGAPGGSGGASAGAGGSGGIDIGNFEGPEMGLKVAFLGDQGIGGPSQLALQTVISEGADFVMLLGDFDYQDDPEAWQQLLDEHLGADFPWFAVVGNHDTDAWEQSPTGGEGYKAKIDRKMTTITGADCVGDPGVQHACRYRGLHFVLSGIGLLGDRDEQEGFIRDTMQGSNHYWRFCGWHLNQHDMQVGAKTDAVGWKAFQECQEVGAFVTSGHEHSYSRTMTLTDVGNPTGGHGEVGGFNLLELMPGRTFVLVNGAGGNGIRVYREDLHAEDTWWANIYAGDYERRDGVATDAVNIIDPSGVAFMEFGVDGDPRKARGYYMTANRKRLVDEFEVTMRR